MSLQLETTEDHNTVTPPDGDRRTLMSLLETTEDHNTVTPPDGDRRTLMSLLETTEDHNTVTPDDWRQQDINATHRRLKEFTGQ